MDGKLTFYYDREADVLYLSKGNPYPEQESQEIEVEGIIILNFSLRFTSIDAQPIPITAQMRLVSA